MSKTVTIALANGGQATITGVGGGFDASISFQLFDAAGIALGAPRLLEQGHFLSSQLVGFSMDAENFQAVPLSSGGFEVIFDISTGDTEGFVHNFLVGVGVDANGKIVAGATNVSDGFPAANFLVGLDHPGAIFKIPAEAPVDNHLVALDGGRFAIAYNIGDAQGAPTAHIGLGDIHGLQTDTVVGSIPDAITQANGDITLTWSQAGSTIREVLGEDGSVLAARGVSHEFTVGVASGGFLAGFDPAHDQLTLVNADGSIAGGTHSTLTFDARDHTLTWDSDSGGPAPATTAAVIGAEKLSVANLADDFRPEVLKVIAADGSSTIQWFDSDHSQTWDTLFATFDTQGRLTTYASTLDDGTRTIFNFDVDNSQPYTRYVDQDDAVGRVLTRTVIYDDGQSWIAKFHYAGAQVINYELDSFDAAGHQVAQSFFNADGSILA